MEKLEDIAKVSSKGQIVIPKEIRERLGVQPGERLLVMTRDKEIILRKTESVSLEEISGKMEEASKKIDVDKLIDEAVKWARSKQS